MVTSTDTEDLQYDLNIVMNWPGNKYVHLSKEYCILIRDTNHEHQV